MTTHIPTVLDIKTDIFRSIMSSYSKKGLDDENHTYFLASALKNLKKLNVGKKKERFIEAQLAKYKKNKDLKKSREDLLLITSLI